MTDASEMRDLARLASMSTEEIMAGLTAFAAAAKAFQEAMRVADLYSIWSKGYEVNGNQDVASEKLGQFSDGDLTKIAEFGTWLSARGRMLRSNGEIRRTGGLSYEP